MSREKSSKTHFGSPEKAKIESGESSLYHRWALRGGKKEAFDKDAIVFFAFLGGRWNNGTSWAIHHSH